MGAAGVEADGDAGEEGTEREGSVVGGAGAGEESESCVSRDGVGMSGESKQLRERTKEREVGRVDGRVDLPERRDMQISFSTGGLS